MARIFVYIRYDRCFLLLCIRFKFILLLFEQIIQNMADQTESNYLQQPIAQSNYLLHNLLEDCSQNQSSFSEQSKKNGDNNEIRVENDCSYYGKRCDRFNLLDDKQQLYIVLPEQLIQEQSQDDSQIFKFTEKNLKVPLLLDINHKINNPRTQYANQTRQDKLRRYLDKKLRRKWQKMIMYRCRKEVADKRERVNGRFARKQSMSFLLSPTHKNSVSTGQVQFIKSLQSSKNDFQQLLL